MNKFLKLMIIPAAFLVVGTSTSCAPSPREIALITDIGDIDDGSFNQESWEAVKEYAEDNHKSYDFYRPFNDSDFARVCAIKQAVAKGAKVIVLPGFKFAATCATVMNKYPSVHFLLIDSYVHNGDYTPIPPKNNVCCVGYKCEYSGFIAGYTIAQDLLARDLNGTTLSRNDYKYGYVGGMASSGVYEFGFGYIQGICKATADFCEENSISNEPNITINYNYAGVFAQDDATAIKVKDWYNNGVKVVFPCGGKLYQSITEAAEYYNKHQTKFNAEDWFNGKLKRNPRDAARWVGVDSDQYRGLEYNHELKSIYTSALKGLNPAIVHALNCHYNNEWEKRIGGNHHQHCPDYVDESTGKWTLGLDCVFGDYDGETPPEPDSYVGIPLPEDKDVDTVFRGYDNYTYGSFKNKLYPCLISADGAPDHIKVYGGDGSDCGGDPHLPGYPNGMPDWITKDGKRFRDEYLGSYPNIEVKVI